jgi:TRAP-type uncharacterized transport system fused permease subunit
MEAAVSGGRISLDAMNRRGTPPGTTAAAAPSAASEGHRLMQGGRLEDALVFAERSGC